MRIILSEEEYFERLSLILKRDFFPSLQEEFSEPERLSISQFQSLYTTEDNASFEELLARENERKRKKFERIYGGPPELVDDPSRRLLLKESSIDEWKYKRKPGEQSNLLLTWNSRVLDKTAPQINMQNTRFPGEKDTLNAKFKIPPSPGREQLAHSLTSKSGSVAKAKHNRQRTPSVPSYSLSDLKGLTPRRCNNQNKDK